MLKQVSGLLTARKPLNKKESIDKETIKVIEEFQRKVCKFTKIDGRIDPNGITIGILINASTLASKATGVVWPLKNNVIRKRKLNHTFGMVRNNKTKPHQGWDFEAKVGTPVCAISFGIVEEVRDKGSYGKQILLSFKHNNTSYFAFYAHLKSVSVKKGDIVVPKQKIALSGKSGSAESLPEAEDHLHFEIRTRRYVSLGLKGRVSPVKIFGRCPLKSSIVQI